MTSALPVRRTDEAFIRESGISREESHGTISRDESHGTISRDISRDNKTVLDVLVQYVQKHAGKFRWQFINTQRRNQVLKHHVVDT